MGKLLILFGLIIVVIGVLLTLLERFGLPHLPGDIMIRRGNSTIYIPIVTSIVISIVLTIILNIVVRLWR